MGVLKIKNEYKIIMFGGNIVPFPYTYFLDVEFYGNKGLLFCH